MKRLILSLGLAALATAGTANAFTPDSGWWWNPDEPGWGLALEVQNDVLFLAAYTYQPDGQATWVNSAAQLQDNRLYVGQLDAYSGGNCIGCPWSGVPSVDAGAGGPVRIEFQTETTALLSWGGRTDIPIERFNFGLVYNTDVPVDVEAHRFVGEWQLVIDQQDHPDFDPDWFPYTADILVFDHLDHDDLGSFFSGCRPSHSLIGRCRDGDNPAEGFYDPNTDTYVILVQETADFSSIFEVNAGFDHIRGFGQLCPNDGSQCLDGDLHVRGFRSASASFVLGDDDAPNSQPVQDKAAQGQAVAGPLSRLLEAKVGGDHADNQQMPKVEATGTDLLRNLRQSRLDKGDDSGNR